MNSYGQNPIEGITKDGRKVVLKPEGTWKFKELALEPRLKPRFKQRKETGMYVLWVALSLLFISAGYFFEHEWEWKLRSHILTEIGIAGVVAFILALTIEYVSRKRDERRFREEKEAIKNDVFEHVLGYRLPEGIFAELDEQILNASFIRKDFTITYKLSALDDHRFIKINGQISYKIFNVTPGRKDFEFVTGIEKAPIRDLDKLVKYTVVKIKGSGLDIDLQTKEDINKAVDYKTPNHLHIRQKITIKGNEHASATIRFEVVRALQGGSEFFLTPILALGFELFVQAWEGIEVSAASYLPEELTEGDQHLKKQNSYHWLLQRPMLPYQGVYVSWKSKEAPPQRDALKPPPAADLPSIRT
jgi:hypothetical protein